MREYLPTNRGEQLANETGLQTLTARLLDKDYKHPLFIVTSLTQEQYWGFDNRAENNLNNEVREARSLLKTNDELLLFNKGMSIDPDTDSWRKIGDAEEGTLFPARKIMPYARAAEEDQLVVSGAAGLSLANFRRQCPLLARSHFENYGFKTYNEACAFVGAYVVGKMVRAEECSLKEKDPSFSYIKDGIMHIISVGGSFHGDFSMTETTTAQSDIMSPINTKTEFGPQSGLSVAGYHSIEPEIVATLIEAEFLKAGPMATLDLVNDFLQTLSDVADASGNIEFQRGNFADYGDGDVQFSLTLLRILLKEDGYDPFKKHASLHSSAFLPQSSTMFEILPTQDGVKFQNKDKNNAERVSGIYIGREHFRDLFGALLGQTALGLGRTSPSQIIQLVYGAKSLLEGSSEKEYPS